MKITEFLFLQSTKGIGDKTILNICRNLEAKGKTSLAELTYHEAKSFEGMGRGLSPFLELIQDDLIVPGIEKEQNYLESLRSSGIEVVTIAQATYPRLLKALSDPPPVIFAKGNLDLLKNVRSAAVVGTRKNTRKGELITQKTVQFLVSEGFCIVSGLALGIDTIAHEACLEAGGETIAVLVDIGKIMPSSNLGLSEKILNEGGLLLSENRPNIKTVPAFFAKRDRIQAGLSSGVFAIETSIDGGTMHAVRAASLLNRPIYVPDAESAGYEDLSIPQLSGTQKLANEGVAMRYTQRNYDDISDSLKTINLG